MTNNANGFLGQARQHMLGELEALLKPKRHDNSMQLFSVLQGLLASNRAAAIPKLATSATSRPDLRPLWQKTAVWQDCFSDQDVMIVGGAVRDYVLGLEAQDIDYCTSSHDQLQVIKKCKAVGSSVKLFESACTAKIKHPDRPQMELACWRKDVYQQPSILRQAHPATWTDDVVRRDFTINAMYMPVGRQGEVVVLDPCGAIGCAQIELIVPGSILEDPLRAIRALRFGAALGLPLSDGLMRELRLLQQLGWSRLVQKNRVRAELDRASRAGLAGEVLQGMNQIGWQPFPNNIATSCSAATGSEKHRSIARWCRHTIGPRFRADFLKWLGL